MQITINYSEKEAEDLFKSFGMHVEQDTIVGKDVGHGHRMPETKQLVVVNPTTRERVLLQNALTRLIHRKLLSDLFWSDKMEVLDALNCKGVTPPMNVINREVSSI